VRITIVGAGYVGLVTAACLADLGHDVTCLDTDQLKIDQLRSGHIPIYEPGLEDLVLRNVPADRLHFSDQYPTAIPDAELIMIAVGTPTADHGKADLTAIFQATDEIARLMEPGTTVVVKSTVPVGTTDEVAARIAEVRPGVGFEIANNPEFLRQGSAVEDFMRPSRIVVGSRTDQAAKTLGELYQPILDGGAPSIFGNLETAELIKYASNSFLAVKLSFVNEMADVCEEAGCDIDQLTQALALDPRIGRHFLQPGPGYGGSCLPKDTQALLHTTQIVGAPSRVVAAAIDVNANRLKRMAKRIVAATGGSVRGKRIAVLGLTFKANTDDLRQSPALEIARSLVGHGARIRVYDPEGMEQARSLISGVEFAEDAYACIESADAVVILTEWAEFATLDLERVRQLVAEPLIVDLRNLYDPATMEESGFTYHSIGR
jgi:UDPglucose 6-dehydrogenase